MPHIATMLYTTITFADIIMAKSLCPEIVDHGGLIILCMAVIPWQTNKAISLERIEKFSAIVFLLMGVHLQPGTAAVISNPLA